MLLREVEAREERRGVGCSVVRQGSASISLGGRKAASGSE